MNRVDQINAEIAKLQAEREDAIQTERANVLAKMKADIKLYDFKATDFKGLLKSRVTKKQVEEFLATQAKKTAATKKVPAARKPAK